MCIKKKCNDIYLSSCAGTPSYNVSHSPALVWRVTFDLFNCDPSSSDIPYHPSITWRPIAMCANVFVNWHHGRWLKCYLNSNTYMSTAQILFVMRNWSDRESYSKRQNKSRLIPKPSFNRANSEENSSLFIANYVLCKICNIGRPWIVVKNNYFPYTILI